jgi:hypothetical protein
MWLAPLLLALAACEAPAPEVSTLVLDLVEDVPGCTATQIASLRSVKVEAAGLDDDGGACRLATQCLDVDVSGNVEALEDDLVAAPQPVFDVESDRLETVRVFGYPSGDCSGPPRLRGFADLPALAVDMLEVPVRCCLAGGSGCEEAALSACP